MILITGGAGFIGSHLAAELVRRGERVRLLGTFTHAAPPELTSLGTRIEFLLGDVRDGPEVIRAMKGVHTVYHLAGVGSPSSPQNQYHRIMEVNVLGTENVLSAALSNGVSRVIVASSASIYGNSPISPKTEDLTPSPQSVYAASKLAAEELCSVFSDRFGLQTVAVRYFNIFGPGQDRDGTSEMVVPRFVRALISGAPLILYGDGRQVRDFIYIDDVVEATIALAGRSDFSGQSVNVASGIPTRVIEIVRALSDAMNRKPNIQFAPEREHEIRESVGSTAMLQSVTGFLPSISVPVGAQMIANAIGRESGSLI